MHYSSVRGRSGSELDCFRKRLSPTFEPGGIAMSDEEAFLATIKASPADDAPRLVYADWLDECGRHEQAEAIRLECEFRRVISRLTDLNNSIDRQRTDQVFPVYGLILRSYPRDRKIEVVRLIVEFTGCGLAEAKSISEALPARLLRPTTFDEITRFRNSFMQPGPVSSFATISIGRAADDRLIEDN